MAAASAPWVGTILTGGRYEVTRKLGEGGMGFVYLAHDANLDTPVVIKVPRQAMLDDPDFAGRFEREVRSLVKLAHPRIVKILDVGTHAGLPFAVMQYLPGGSLNDRRPKGRGGSLLALPPDQLALWLMPVAEGLDFVHEQGYVHRDVKPDNILFDAHGNPYLGDFGVAKAVYDQQPNKQKTVMTGSGMVLGTPQYMAPEMILGEQFDGRVDQYALAVTVYEVLSGGFPFDGPTGMAILMKQTQELPPSLQELVPGLAPDIAGAVHQALDKSPAGRFPNCMAFARAVLGTPAPAPAGGAAPQRTLAATAAPPQRPPTTSAAARPATAPGMVPTIEMPCPSCGAVLKMSAASAGKRGRCRHCGATFEAKAAPATRPQASPAPAEQVRVETSKGTRLPTRAEASPVQPAAPAEQARLETGKGTRLPTKAERSPVQPPVPAKRGSRLPWVLLAVILLVGAGAGAVAFLGFARRSDNPPTSAAVASRPPASEAAPVQKPTVPTGSGPTNPPPEPTTDPSPQKKDPPTEPQVPRTRPKPPPRVPEPDAAAQAVAEKEVRDTYKKEYTQGDAAGAKALALKLLEQGRQSGTAPAMRFMLWREARDLAVRAGDLSLAFQAIDALSRDFTVDGVAMKSTALETLNKQVRTSEDARAFVPFAVAAFWESLAGQDATRSAQLLSLTRLPALRTEDIALISTTADAGESLVAVQAFALQLKTFEDALKKDPKDAAANLALGRYHCLMKGDWETGLPFLARGSNARLKALAEKDLARPGETADELALGDGWWDLSQTEAMPAHRQLRERAAYWYLPIVADLEGEAKARVEKRLRPPPDDLPKLLPPQVSPPKVFTGHTETVLCAALTPDGRYALSGGEDKSLRLWDIAAGKELRKFDEQHKQAVSCVTVSPDGKRALTGDYDHTIWLWDLEKRKEIRPFTGHTNRVHTVAFLPDGKRFLSWASDKTMRLWDVDGKRPPQKFEGPAHDVLCAALSPDGSRVLTWSLSDKALRLWDLAGNKEVKKLTTTKEAISSVAFSPNGLFALSGGNDFTARLWELEAGKEAQKLEGHKGGVRSVVFSPDGRRALTATGNALDKPVRMWDLETGKEIIQFAGQEKGTVSSIVFAADGRHALTTSDDKAVRWWSWKPVTRPADVPALVLALDDGNKQVRQLAGDLLRGDDLLHKEIIRLSGTAAPNGAGLALLIVLLKHEDAALRLLAVNALGQRGPAAQVALGPLEVAQNDSDQQVRLAAKAALEKIRRK